MLAGIPAVASAFTFVVAGFLATTLSWRWSYWLIVLLGVVVLILSYRLTPIPRQRGIHWKTIVSGWGRERRDAVVQRAAALHGTADLMDRPSRHLAGG